MRGTVFRGTQTEVVAFNPVALPFLQPPWGLASALERGLDLTGNGEYCPSSALPAGPLFGGTRVSPFTYGVLPAGLTTV